ncbi:unnamed protein product [Euphydryas editha]|uniref:Uncharacterized protein n=1 Tax=Euphydryas editha TaxID=104508 RepID=A0AAU9U2E5_EUPED|nr:unnamed protein product [Euphydryas editha]
MINLVLQPEFADDNTDRAASVAANASVKNPPHLDASLIMPDDLGFNVESISPMSETPSQLLSPTTSADFMPILFSSDDEEEPLMISTRAIVHFSLEGSNEVSSAANENLNNISVSLQSVRPSKLPSPDLDAILSLGSDDSVQNPHCVPPSKKMKAIVFI